MSGRVTIFIKPRIHRVIAGSWRYNCCCGAMGYGASQQEAMSTLRKHLRAYAHIITCEPGQPPLVWLEAQ